MENNESLLTRELLSTIFEYREGRLFNKIHRTHNSKIGKRSGSFKGNNPYWSIHINKASYQEHRLIFFMFNGYFPLIVDHIKDDITSEGIKSNRIENLQDVSQSVNCHKQIRKKKKKNNGYYKGVCWYARSSKWIVQIMHKSKLEHIGYFKDPKAGAKAYDFRANQLFGKFASLNFPKDQIENS